jgi:hypothetical protein
MNTDTPLPPDEPTAPNPPEGAIIDYYLKSQARTPVVLEIFGPDGKLVRKYSSEDRAFTPDPARVTLPLYWFRPLRAMPTTAGMHRVTWDLHYQPLDSPPDQPGQLGGPNLPIAAVGHDTVPAATTPWVNPGRFTVKLTVDGKSYAQPITVKQDPRVKTPAIVMQQVYTLSKAMYYEARAATLAIQEAKARGNTVTDLESATAALARAMNLLQEADVRPTAVKLKEIASARAATAQAMAKWTALRK